MFTKLYLDTTNPKNTLAQMICQNKIPLFVSILLHTIIYAAVINLASFIFYNKRLSTDINIRLLIVLFIIMTLGYIGRYYHVKDIYNAYNKNMEKTRHHLDKLYISWVFIA
jgi:hypothetical protein